MICEMDNCGRPVVARRLCTMHYQRLRHTFHALPEKTTRQRFMEKVISTDGCWQWGASIGKNGYGQFFFSDDDGSSMRLAHRVSYVLHVGPIPSGRNVLHTCDNRKCVNPEHLFIGTQSDNLIDALKKGRAPAMKLCEVDVELIKSLNNKTLKEVADWFGISTSQVWNIRNNKQWKHV